MCKVCDFGLSKQRSHTYVSGLGGGERGTVQWMAPEVLLDSEHVDEKADVYSFGVVMCLPSHPPCSAAKKRGLRIGTGGMAGGRGAHAAVSRRPPASLCTNVVRGLHARRASLSLVQGAFPVAPCAEPNVTIRNSCIAVSPLAIWYLVAVALSAREAPGRGQSTSL